MLKIYTKLDDVPEALREHYKLVDGRYVPELADDHPVLIHNKKLVMEKSQATAKVTELEADIEQAKQTSVPRGHVAVPKADAEALSKFKALGEVDDVTTRLTEHKSLKEEVGKRQLQDSHRKVAKVLGYNEEAFSRLPNLPEFEIRGEGDKQQVIAKVQDGKNIVEKPAADYVAAEFAPFLPSLQATEGVSVHGSRSGTQQPPANLYDKIRKEVKAKQTDMPVHRMFQPAGAPAQGE